MSAADQATFHALLVEFQQALAAEQTSDEQLRVAFTALYATVIPLYHRAYLPVMQAADIPAMAFLKLQCLWLGFPMYPSHPEQFEILIERDQLVQMCAPLGISLWAPDVGGALVPTAAQEHESYEAFTAFVGNYRALLDIFRANRQARMRTFEVAVRFSRISVIPVIMNENIDSVELLTDHFGWDGLALYPTINALLDQADALVDMRAYAAQFERQIFSGANEEEERRRRRRRTRTGTGSRMLTSRLKRVNS